MKKITSKIYRFLIASIICGSMTEAFAQQQGGIAFQRRVLDEAISTIEDYESFATVSDEEIQYNFIDLFTDGKAPVYNDLLGVSSAKEIPVSEYSKMLSNGLQSKQVVIKNIKKDRLWNDNGVWKVTMSFDKSTSYNNACGIHFSSSEFYSQDYRMVATMVYDERMGKCKIESITGAINSNKDFPDRYFVFETQDKRDLDLLYYGEKMKFNRYGQAFLRGSYDERGFRYLDPDMEIKPIYDSDCDKVSMKYRMHKFRMKLHYDLGLGDAFKLEGADAMSTKKSSSNSFGIDFGYSIPSESSFKTAIFVGIGLTQSKIDLSYQNRDYNYTSSEDVDGDTYFRHYENLNLEQTVKLTALTIPVYVDFSYSFSKAISAYLDLGAKLNSNMTRKIDATKGSANIYGIYPTYENLRLDEHWGYNGFGEHTFDDSELVNDEVQGVESLTFDLMGSAGLRFNIPTTPLAIDLGFNYLLGLNELIKQQGSQIGEQNNPQSQFVYNSVSGLNNKEHMRNLTDVLSSVKRQSMKLSLGLIYKF